MTASIKGKTPVVRHLARLGCSLSHTTVNGHTALDYARDFGHHDTARLLEDIDSAGGWRPYAAAQRMAYVRIRHEVSRAYKVLDERHDDRALLHFVFGRNRADGGPLTLVTTPMPLVLQCVRFLRIVQQTMVGLFRYLLLGGERTIAAAADENRARRGDAALEEAPADGSGKPEAMQVLPDDVFPLVCRYLEGWSAAVWA